MASSAANFSAPLLLLYSHLHPILSFSMMYAYYLRSLEAND